MKRIIATVVFLMCAASLAPLHADEPQEQHIVKKVSENTNLIGTWRLVSYKYGNMKEFKTFSTDSVLIKSITPTHFIWINYDAHTKKVGRSGGGHCTVEGDKYTETMEYGLGDDVLPMIGKDQVFTDKVEGDKLTHSGTLSIGLKIEEIYERVKG